MTAVEVTEEDESPDEETFEEIAIEVRFPSPLKADGFDYYVLRSRVTTLALSGLTPEEAADESGTEPTPINSGSSGSTGGSSTGTSGDLGAGR